MISLLLLGICSCLLVLMLNRSYIGNELSLRRFPLIEAKTTRGFNLSIGMFSHLGAFIKPLLPKNFYEELESEYLYLGRKSELLLELLGQVVSIALLLITVYWINHNLYFLILSLLLPILLLFEIKFATNSYYKQLEDDALHLYACAKILLINTETPLISALRIIIATYPTNDSATVYELNKIVSKIEKLGAREALSSWQVKSQGFRDFISFLLSVSEGANKRALKVAATKFINDAREQERDALVNQAENLQLYLVAPVILMLLVIMYPMASAINFMMQTSLLKGDGL